MMFKSCFSDIKQNIWEYILPVAAFLLAFALRYHFLVTYRYPLMIHEQDAVGYGCGRKYSASAFSECLRKAARLSNRNRIISLFP